MFPKRAENFINEIFSYTTRWRAQRTVLCKVVRKDLPKIKTYWRPMEQIMLELVTTLILLKVSKSQKLFSWNSIAKKTNEIFLDKILPYEARAEFCQIFRSVFGQWSFKIKCFSDLLTYWDHAQIRKSWRNLSNNSNAVKTIAFVINVLFLQFITHIKL